MKEFFDENPEISTIIYAGKGGLGKSTMSAATAHWFSTHGQRSIAFSTDPQASLTDVFETKLFGRGEQKLGDNLYSMEIDGDKRIAEFQDRIREEIKEVNDVDEIPEEIDEYIETTSSEPAMYECATYDAMAGLLGRGEYSKYILDLPPFGHGVRMISMAEILDAWIDKMEETRQKAAKYKEVQAQVRGGKEFEKRDIVLEKLQDIRKKLDFFADTLTDEEKTAFIMVLVPREMALVDTRRALEMFEKMGITLSGVVVNQVYPPRLLEEEKVSNFIKQKIESQQKYMKQIKEEFGEYIRAVIPMFQKEPKGFDMIDKVSDHLFGSLKFEGFEL